MAVTGSRVIVALDFPNERDVLAFVDSIDAHSCRLKIGKQLFTACGPQLVRRLVDAGHHVFLDLKFHDIPNTVGEACRAATDLGVWMMNVHALGGSRMMEAAQKAVDGSDSLLIAVTLLTSADQQELDELGLPGTPESLVLRLASLAERAGLDGVVCSAEEGPVLRKQLAANFLLVTPGIRLADDSKGDQKRVLTPGHAVANGASYLVIGRSITQATDPAAVLQRINRELDSVTA